MTISDTCFWVLDEAGMQREHAFDQKIFDNILRLFRVEYKNKPRIIDLGCGRCDYTNRLLDLGHDVIGVDGNPATKQYCRNPDKIFVHDLTQPLELNPFDVVICLEVGEHIPVQYERNLIDNINRLLKPGGHLILSWSIDFGDSGYGHVNCRPNLYIRDLFGSLGYTSLPRYDRRFRSHVEKWWFKHTVMIFKKGL